MLTTTSIENLASLDDHRVVDRVVAGETQLFELLMRRHNRRVFLVARGVVRDESEAEDIVQASYLDAYSKLSTLSRRASFGPWLLRIALRHSLRTVQRARRAADAARDAALDHAAESSPRQSPEGQAVRDELRERLEHAIDCLPRDYRLVFVLRVLEDMSTAETAKALGTNSMLVKIRLRRARAHLRLALGSIADDARAWLGPFPYAGTRCDGMVRRVMTAIGAA